MHFKQSIYAELQGSSWLSVPDLAGRVTGTCESTISRALRKLRAEGLAEGIRIPGDSHCRKQWRKGSSAVVGPRARMLRTPTAGLTPAQRQELTMQIEQAVEAVITDFTAALKRFSVHDVTNEIRDRVNKGVLSIDRALAGTAPNVSPTTTNIRHEDVKPAVVEAFASGKLPGYDRTHNGTFFEYHPAAPATVPPTPPSADPAKPYDGSSTL